MSTTDQPTAATTPDSMPDTWAGAPESHLPKPTFTGKPTGKRAAARARRAERDSRAAAAQKIAEATGTSASRALVPVERGSGGVNPDNVTYTPEMGARVCEQVSQGFTLKQLAEMPQMPHMHTVFLWLARHEDFRTMYDAARSVQMESFIEECLEIADDGSNDYIDRVNPRTGEITQVPNYDHINRSRLRVDTRKWIAGKIVPNKWGERPQVELTASVKATFVVEK
jgi:hypothetical protein